MLSERLQKIRVAESCTYEGDCSVHGTTSVRRGEESIAVCAATCVLCFTLGDPVGDDNGDGFARPLRLDDEGGVDDDAAAATVPPPLCLGEPPGAEADAVVEKSPADVAAVGGEVDTRFTAHFS